MILEMVCFTEKFIYTFSLILLATAIAYAITNTGKIKSSILPLLLFGIPIEQYMVLTLIIISIVFIISNKIGRKELTKSIALLSIDMDNNTTEVKGLSSRVGELEDSHYNNTEDKLSIITESLHLDPFVKADAGIIRYFQNKRDNVVTQYLRISALIRNENIQVAEKLCDENFKNNFVGGGSSELRIYYNYEGSKGDLHFYPDNFLKYVDEVNMCTYDLFLKLFNNYYIAHNDQIKALRLATVQSFKKDVESIYNEYIEIRKYIDDPELKLLEAKNVGDNERINDFIGIIKKGGNRSLTIVLQKLLRTNIDATYYDEAVAYLSQLNNLLERDKKGDDVKERINEMKENVLTLLDLIKES